MQPRRGRRPLTPALLFPAAARPQIGFIAFVVRPLYLTLVKIAPDLESCLHRIDACTKMWQDMKAAAQAAGGGTGVAGTAR